MRIKFVYWHGAVFNKRSPLKMFVVLHCVFAIFTAVIQFSSCIWCDLIHTSFEIQMECCCSCYLFCQSQHRRGGGGNKRHAFCTQCTSLPDYHYLFLRLHCKRQSVTNHRISVDTICVHWWRGVINMNRLHFYLKISVISIAQKISHFNFYYSFHFV